MMRLFGAAALLLVMGAAIPEAWAGDREDCGNGQTVVNTEPATRAAACRRLANQGDAISQFLLGHLYDTGRGVPEDATEAAKWYQKAADEGFPAAQFVLGTFYGRGHGVPQDDVQSYMWLTLAGANGNAGATMLLGLMSSKMTPAQIEHAKALAAAWKPTTGQ